ncbi:hypothetical protein ACFL09_05160, partial [Planctomycetota bacterium]
MSKAKGGPEFWGQYKYYNMGGWSTYGRSNQSIGTPTSTSPVTKHLVKPIPSSRTDPTWGGVLGTTRAKPVTQVSKPVQTYGTKVAGTPSTLLQAKGAIWHQGVAFLGTLVDHSECKDALLAACEQIDRKQLVEAGGALIALYARYREHPGEAPGSYLEYTGSAVLGYAPTPDDLLDYQMSTSHLSEKDDDGYAHESTFLWVTLKLLINEEYDKFPIVGKRQFEATYDEWWVFRWRRAINNFMDDRSRGEGDGIT